MDLEQGLTMFGTSGGIDGPETEVKFHTDEVSQLNVSDSLFPSPLKDKIAQEQACSTQTLVAVNQISDDIRRLIENLSVLVHHSTPRPQDPPQAEDEHHGAPAQHAISQKGRATGQGHPPVGLPEWQDCDTVAYAKSSMMPDRFDGKVSWPEYRRHFEACARINGWTDEQKRDYLYASLKGNAQGLMLDETESFLDPSYDELVSRLEKRYGPGEQAETFLTEVRTRVRKHGESLRELAQNIRRLTALAYPELDRNAHDRLARGHFLDAIQDPEIRAGIYLTKPKTLDDAVGAVMFTESYMEAEKYRTGQQKTKFHRGVVEDTRASGRENSLTEQVKILVRTLQKLIENTDGNRETLPTQARKPSIVCYHCTQNGHIARDCPVRTRKRKGRYRTIRE